MLMDLYDLADKYGMFGKMYGILHLGAHLCEERIDYERIFPGVPVWWVEANPAVISVIQENLEPYPNQHIIQALVYSEDGVELPFNRTNYDGMSSSIHDFGIHPTFSPDTVMVDQIQLVTSTVDTLVSDHGIQCNFIVADLQAAEGPAFRGASQTLRNVDWIMSEVNCKEVYIGGTRVEELDEILSEFDRVETFWVGEQGWGDCFMTRKGL